MEKWTLTEDDLHEDYFERDNDGKIKQVPKSELTGVSLLSNVATSLDPNSWYAMKGASFWQVQGDPNPDFNASTGEYTIPSDGYYDCKAVQSIINIEDGKKLIVALGLNGANKATFGRGTVGGQDYAGFGGALTLPFVAGDKITVRTYHNGDTAKQFAGDGGCSFSVMKR